MSIDPTADRPEVAVTHRRYVAFAEAHYAGNLVDGAYSLKLFGDVATDLCIATDGDEGLFASYSDVQFLAPIRAGDVLEVTATLLTRGTRSRSIAFTARVLARGAPTTETPGRAEVLDDPLVVTTARGVVVVPPRRVAQGHAEAGPITHPISPTAPPE